MTYPRLLAPGFLLWGLGMAMFALWAPSVGAVLVLAGAVLSVTGVLRP